MANRTGTSKNDKLTGTAASDRLFGLGGNDLLIGLGGNDTLDGSTGNDTLDGGIGNDKLIGGAGNDTFIVTATSGTDVFSEVSKNGGTDTVVSSRASFTLGNPTATANHIENLTLTGAAVTGIGNSLNNVITGNSLANKLSGMAGNDTLNGGVGNDSLNGGLGNDSMAGGAGNDTYVVNVATDKVSEVGSGIDTVQSMVTFSLSVTGSTQIENLVLQGTGAINGTGNTLANTITGNGGNNVLSGLGGNDKLDGGAGHDTLDGGANNDTLIGGIGNDSLGGGTGNDSMAGGAGNDLYVVDATGDVVVEAAPDGNDTVQASVSETLDANVENLVLTGAALTGTGNSLANTLVGNTGGNTLTGLAGDDMLDGGAGADTMTGGLDDDIYVVSEADDVVVEADEVGIDTVRTALADYTLGDNVENLALLGDDGISGSGNSLANSLTGNEGANTLSGGEDADTLKGGAGADSLEGGEGDDVLVWDTEDTLEGGNGTDTIRIEADGLADLSLPETLMGGIEAIDLAGNVSLKLDPYKVMNSSLFTSGEVTVHGGAGDEIFAEGGWALTADGDTVQYDHGNGATLFVDRDINRDGIGIIEEDLLDLDGKGIRITSEALEIGIGRSVAAGGDVNGDGYDDFIVAAPGAGVDGEVYVIYGNGSAFATELDLAALDGTNGFKIFGGDVTGSLGSALSATGDVNGDGLADIVIGTGDEGAGTAFVVFGSSSFGTGFDLSALDGTNGVRLIGENGSVDNGDYAGRSVSLADVNGDGYSDVIVGAPGIDGDTYGEYGGFYVVYGKEAFSSSSFNLGALGADGSFLAGQDEDDETGYSVSGAGDVNGDGLDDLIIGSANFFTPEYLIFGSPGFDLADLNIEDLESAQGRIYYTDSQGDAGRSVSAAGDVNGDGVDDLILGDPYNDRSYVVFGGEALSGFEGNLETLDGTAGFRIEGPDGTGYSVAGTGDVNGDGYDDLVIGAQGEENYAFVVFGTSSFTSSFSLASIDGLNGFRLEESGSNFGHAVSGGRDLNGDGFDDVIIGAPDGPPGGHSYVLFGRNFGNVVTHLGTAAAETLTGTAGADVIVAGDGNDTINGMGGDDVFHAGSGNDRIVMGAGDPLRVDGGAGTDTVALDGFSASILLDGIQTSSVESIEKVDLSGTHANTVVVTKTGVLNLSDTTNTVTVEGDGGDAVTLIGGWEEGDTLGDYTDWTSGAATVRIHEDVAVHTDSLSLGALDGGNGVALAGISVGDRAGHSVAAAGDVDGDGLGDIIIGATGADVGLALNAGETYVVFGDALAGESALDLSALTGSSGFRLDGFQQADTSGYSVASAGDVNGDGYADVIIGAHQANPPAGNSAGQAYVVFGSSTLASSLVTTALDGTNGFSLDGVVAGDFAGAWVSSAGDVNGDGYGDVLVGANTAGGNTGQTYLVYGQADGFASSMSLASSEIVRFDGITAGDFSGRTVASAGDFNGDGYDDILIGVGDNPNECYVVFGSSAPLPAETDLSALNGTDGFRIDGASATQFGRNAASAGDFNGDGYGDLIIGGNTANSSAGRSYVIFGEAGPQNPFMTLEDLDLDGSGGFVINGVAPADDSGVSIASAGDFNGDGYDDVIIGALNAGAGDAGVSYIVFGGAEEFESGSFDLSSLDGLNGFALTGIAAGDHSGRSVASAGDVNGDGYDDVIIGAQDFGDADHGASYVVYGGNRNGAVDFDGGTGNDVLTGTTDDDNFEAFVGGLGNDTLTGGLGDAFSGGAGNDVISLGANEFQRVDGGAGFDTLLFGAANFDLSFSSPGSTRVMGIEAVDLRGNGDADFELSLQDLLDLSDTSNVLTIEGDAGDEVYMLTTTGWTEQTDQGTYNVWTQGAATLKVDTDVSVYFET